MIKPGHTVAEMQHHVRHRGKKRRFFHVITLRLDGKLHEQLLKILLLVLLASEVFAGEPRTTLVSQGMLRRHLSSSDHLEVSVRVFLAQCRHRGRDAGPVLTPH